MATKNIARWYSAETMDCDPWVWFEYREPKPRYEGAKMPYVQWLTECERRLLLSEVLFVVEDYNRPGCFRCFNDLEAAQALCDEWNEYGACAHILPESRGLAH